jgi:hypothetical protein
LASSTAHRRRFWLADEIGYRASVFIVCDFVLQATGVLRRYREELVSVIKQIQ